MVTIVLTLHLLIPALPTASILINSVTLALWTPLSLLLTLSPSWTLFPLPHSMVLWPLKEICFNSEISF